ncbi:DUF1786 family protein [Fundidesulfovibrio terrae]|uniref:DUF1786 family protein n=1 Tax=Fundidesulfovibrio terrae TaxID=2922866 RepID=UPI001FAF525D|nr:DUF1786 family protein [Fundidesulfovibrio terrae]
MRSILCLDIGSGTQDALYFMEGRSLENCPKFVLPAPAKLVAARIKALTAQKRPIHLCGHNMGGGFLRAARDHAAAGLAISAHPEAALALTDDPPSIIRHGIVLSGSCPSGHVPVHLADYDPGFWQSLLALAGLEPPELVLACAQDHGHHPGQSSRTGRFGLWERFLAGTSGRLDALLYDTPPVELTRLATIQQATGGGPVMDTGPAAALGALFDPAVEAVADDRGTLVVNMGNSHVLGLLVHQGRLAGVYEHHTGQIEIPELVRQLELFRKGALRNEDVFDTGGHGCAVRELTGTFDGTFVIGPRRGELGGMMEAVFPAPGGDMMLAGCFGMLKAWKERGGE